IYRFDEPFTNATYPVWYDASYWYEGVTISLELKKQVLAILRHLYYYSRMFSLYGALIGLGAGLLLANHMRLGLCVVRHWWFFIPCLSLMVIYSLVHVEPRLVAPFLITVFLVMIS